MKPSDRSTEAAKVCRSAPLAIPTWPSPPTRPKLPPRTVTVAGVTSRRVMTLMVPPKASAPNSDDPAPCSTSIRSTAASGTGMSPLWCPDCASFNRTPSTSTSIWPKVAPRTAKSDCTPRSPRARTSTEDVRRSTSAMVRTGSWSICSRVMTVRVRVTLPRGTGVAAAVTTTD